MQDYRLSQTLKAPYGCLAWSSGLPPLTLGPRTAPGSWKTRAFPNVSNLAHAEIRSRLAGLEMLKSYDLSQAASVTRIIKAGSCFNETVQTKGMLTFRASTPIRVAWGVGAV